MIVQCCVCKKVRDNGQWTYPGQPIADPSQVSHGYCPECAAQAFSQLSRQTQVATPSRKSSDAA